MTSDRCTCGGLLFPGTTEATSANWPWLHCKRCGTTWISARAAKVLADLGQQPGTFANGVISREADAQ